MKASEYKAFKGIRKESLRDNIFDIEIVLTDLGKIATKNTLNYMYNQEEILEKENKMIKNG